jgi:spore coat polysaccharide biosynthesis predicted glycosyltransferase SpsG
MSRTEGSIVFAVAAGPRMGFGHLMRSRSLARALGVPWRVCLRGSAATRRIATRLGAELVTSPLARTSDPVGLLVVDDPSRREASRWVASARHHGVPVASIHDRGLGEVASDLVVDGSVYQTPPPGMSPGLRGPAFAILDPSMAGLTRSVVEHSRPRILITLGGGAHVQASAAGLCRELAASRPGLTIRVARGFVDGREPAPLPHGEWIQAPQGLAEELTQASVAIVSGGVSLAEACAIGVPVVAVAVTRAQHVAIRTLANLGAVVDGGSIETDNRLFAQVAAATLALLDSQAERDRLSRNASQVIDGRGALRVAAHLRRLMSSADRSVNDAA